ncbi:MAG TPA: replication/maintenance protein [Cyanobacteria bacterium UBA8553]|nr:replication/maintenance protein [Cyanobacteria bacterium UBA8553]
MLTQLPVKYPDLMPHTFSRDDAIPLRPDALWLLKQGVVRTLTWSEEGKLVSLGYWTQGDVVGQPLSRLQSYEIQCLTGVEANCIPPHQWHQVLDAIFWHIQQTEDLLNIVRIERVNQRLLQLLVWLTQKFGREVNSGQLIDLRLTHQAIAEIIGTTRVTVTRLLNEFEREGIISRPRRQFITLRSNFYSNF